MSSRDFPDLGRWGELKSNVLYETGTGRIKQFTVSKNLGTPDLPDGWSELIVDEIPDMNDPNSFQKNYVVDGQIVPRPDLGDIVTVGSTSAAADGADECTISGLPEQCTVVIDGEGHIVDDGELSLTSDMPATYTVTIEHWPYMPWSQEFIFEDRG